MRFREMLEAGLVPEFGKPDRIITTLVSQLFIFGEKVLKVYKHESFFFADLLDFELRKAFYVEDFFWNNTAAPEVYLHLWGVQERGGAFALVPPGIGEDFVIEMSKIDDTKMLTQLLLRKQLSKTQTAAFIEALVDTLKILTQERRTQLHDLFEKRFLDTMQEDIESLHAWMSGETKVSKKDTDAIYEMLAYALEQEPYFKIAQSDQLSAAIDNNSDNLILLHGKPSFIDIMPPMVIWRVADAYATISRTIVDIELLGGQELGDVARATYAKYHEEIPTAARLVHELRAVSIQWAYRYMIKQDELAKTYGTYAKEKLKELKNAL